MQCCKHASLMEEEVLCPCPVQVAINNNGGPDDGSKVVFTAEAHTPYFIVLEANSPPEDCGDTLVDVLGPPPPGAILLIVFFVISACQL